MNALQYTIKGNSCYDIIHYENIVIHHECLHNVLYYRLHRKYYYKGSASAPGSDPELVRHDLEWTKKYKQKATAKTKTNGFIPPKPLIKFS